VKHRPPRSLDPAHRLALAALLATLLVLSAGGCATTVTSEPSPALDAAAEVEMSVAVHWVRNSAEHRALFEQIYAGAESTLVELAGGRAPGTWAVAIDADETVLDNSLYQKELEERGEPFTPASWAAWVERRAAPPLPGAVSFLEKVHELGGRVAVVTNRDEPLCPATVDDFRHYDIPFDVILCRGETSEKEPRWRRVEQGTASKELPALEILMWLGDNIEDFPGLDQGVRAGDGDGAAFGRRFIVLPNPMYGSFLRNPPQ
jgi:5'-nucleotidase (lipoprotein e(P4) family)